ncbi:condensation domain-containing protein [Actinoplanes sp. RD1]|uniref:condensation domain-containing protein n=1 Tax=Actinoplanes sp. RD1 TaxID=3064538 RepID=UPI0027416E35|nr:condensation domain-containing protein [Actinoplanes sp. RD1]
MIPPAQEMLWEFARSLFPESPGALGVNAAEAVTLLGPLDVPRLRAAIAAIGARHDALRLVYTDTSDDPSARYLDDVAVPLTAVDLSGLPPRERAARLGDLVRGAEDRPFDVLRAPLWEVRLIRLGAAEHVLAVSLCHLIADGRSAQIVLRDLGRAYGGEPLPPVPGYSEVLDSPGADAARATAYWRDRLRPPADAEVFPWTDRSASVDTGIELPVRFDFGERLAAGVRQAATRHRSTPFLVLLGAYRALLAARTGRPRVVIGTTTLGRGPRSREVVGQFTTNTYVATTVPDGATLAEVLELVRAETVLALRHAAPYRLIAAAANDDFARQRPWPQMHLYDVWFQSDLPPLLPDFAGLEVRPAPPGPPDAGPSPEAVPVPVRPGDARWLAETRKRVTPWVLADAAGTGITVHYGPAFYDRPQVDAWISDYAAVLAALIEDPHRPVHDVLTAAAA